MNVVAFDTETHLIEPGLLAPPLVCVQWAERGENAKILHREHSFPLIKRWIEGHDLLVGHNVAYDLAVIGAQWPHLLPAIFAKYDRDEITDTMLRDQLLAIARGIFRYSMGPDGPEKTKFSLADCIMRHFGRFLKKEGWRLFYRAFDTEPYLDLWEAHARWFQERAQQGIWPEWAANVDVKDRAGLLAARPSEALEYALADATNTLALFDSQEVAEAKFLAQGVELFADQFRQARAAFGLHLSSCWGIHTDGEAVDELEISIRQEYECLESECKIVGLIRDDGTADTKAAKEAMVLACSEQSLPVFVTKKGAVSLSAEACERFDSGDGEPLEDNAAVIAAYSRFLTLRKMLTNDVKMLQAGTEQPIQARYDLADTGRTRCSKPNLQAINRGAGIRESFRPREGCVFAQADYEGLELHTLAAWCLERIGWSKLADALNAGRDVHLDMAAELLGITYEEALARKAAGDKEIKEYRQRAKALNFGLPGGLGAAKFARYAKASYGVIISEGEAAAYKAAWLRRYPEMNEFFRLASQATATPEKLGDETHIFTGRHRGSVRYSALCNGRFQGLGADVAKEALWRVSKACYTEPASPLYGSHIVAFIHDEIIVECEESRGAEIAQCLGQLMTEGANKYLGKVPVRLAPQLMRIWSKAAEPIFNEEGKLVPWESKK